jgi:queuine tRNA-ribosyltransferase
MVLLPQAHFEIQAECPVTRARAGLLHTAHGTVETPVFMPVGTHASVKGHGSATSETISTRK